MAFFDGGGFLSRKKTPTRADIIPVVLPYLNDPDENKRTQAAGVLFKLTGETRDYRPYAAAPERAPAVEAWNRWWDTQRAGIERISKEEEDTRLKKEVDNLIELLKNEKPDWTPTGVIADRDYLSGTVTRNRLTHIARHEYRNYVIAKINDLIDSDCLNARYYAISLIGDTKPPGAEDRLIGLLKSPDPGTVQLAAYALQGVGSPKVFPELTRVMQSQGDPIARAVAAFTLGKLGGKAAIPFFIEMLEHKDSHVRDVADKCLGQLIDLTRKDLDVGPETPIPVVLDRLKDWWKENSEKLKWDPKVRTFRVDPR